MSQSLVCLSAINNTVVPAVCSTGWQVVETALGFDISQLDPASILSAFTAGAVVSFVPLSIAWACSFLLNTIRGA
ncbi:conserved hypothetical protein [Gammaproteobacteria bacterium]